ncbi:MAG: hypothetical protein JWM21_1235 [Acidobacteria bacterium]|nr:hypothetical protein [Acidobacteriota bacterium]
MSSLLIRRRAQKADLAIFKTFQKRNLRSQSGLELIPSGK